MLTKLIASVMLSGALMYHLLMPPVGEDPVGELRDHMTRVLRQTGFEVSPMKSHSSRAASSGA